METKNDIHVPIKLDKSDLNQYNQRILRTRAQKLSKVLAENTSSDGYLEMIEFNLGSERYAIETEYVKEALDLKDFASLPCTSLVIHGVMNVRGTIYALINLKALLNIDPDPDIEQLKVIVLEDDESSFGIVIDRIDGIIQMREAMLNMALETLDPINQELVKGIAKQGLVVLDGQKLLRDQRLVVRDEA